ncbi:HAD hydrolase-like protein [bacterium]|nr:HAD hydrolase-like protein [bacterium]
MERYVLIHREGAVNVRQDNPITKLDEFVFLPFVHEAFRELQLNDVKPIILTWEESLHTGAMPQEEYDKIVQEMKTSIEEEEGKIHDVLTCPGPMAPWDKCALPKGGMLQIAAAKHKLNLAETYFICDRIECLEAAWSVGCKTILVRSGKPFKTLQALRKSPKQPDKTERDLLSAAIKVIQFYKETED